MFLGQVGAKCSPLTRPACARAAFPKLGRIRAFGIACQLKMATAVASASQSFAMDAKEEQGRANSKRGSVPQPRRDLVMDHRQPRPAKSMPRSTKARQKSVIASVLGLTNPTALYLHVPESTYSFGIWGLPSGLCVLCNSGPLGQDELPSRQYETLWSRDVQATFPRSPIRHDCHDC